MITAIPLYDSIKRGEKQLESQELESLKRVEKNIGIVLGGLWSDYSEGSTDIPYYLSNPSIICLKKSIHKHIKTTRQEKRPQ